MRDEQTFDFDEPTPPAAPRTGGGGCMKGCLIGCGVLFLIGIIVAGVGTYLFMQRVTTDPLAANRMLQDTVDCEIPDGYQAKLGMQLYFSFVVVMPVAAEFGEDNDTHTMFIVFTVPGMNQRQLEQNFELQRQQHGVNDPQGVEESEVELQVGNRKVKGSKLVGQNGGKKVVGYQLFVAPSVLFFAQGPEEDFDLAAMEAFLKSMPGEAAEAPDEPKNAAPVGKNEPPAKQK